MMVLMMVLEMVLEMVLLLLTSLLMHIQELRAHTHWLLMHI